MRWWKIKPWEQGHMASLRHRLPTKPSLKSLAKEKPHTVPPHPTPHHRLSCTCVSQESDTFILLCFALNRFPYLLPPSDWVCWQQKLQDPLTQHRPIHKKTQVLMEGGMKEWVNEWYMETPLQISQELFSCRQWEGLGALWPELANEITILGGWITAGGLGSWRPRDPLEGYLERSASKLPASVKKSMSALPGGPSSFVYFYPTKYKVRDK